MSAPPVLEGALVRLRPIVEEDFAALLKWYTDPDVIYWLGQSDRRTATYDDIRERFDPETAGTAIRWTIDTLDNQSIGVIRLEGIDTDHRGCELAISIGEKASWSNGYGTAAIRLALTHAFATLGLRRVWLITDADNARGIRCYEKCGFQHEGTLRAHRLRHGQPIDMVTMGVLREEWAASE